MSSFADALSDARAAQNKKTGTVLDTKGSPSVFAHEEVLVALAAALACLRGETTLLDEKVVRVERRLGKAERRDLAFGATEKREAVFSVTLLEARRGKGALSEADYDTALLDLGLTAEIVDGLGAAASREIPVMIEEAKELVPKIVLDEDRYDDFNDRIDRARLLRERLELFRELSTRLRRTEG